MLVRLVTSSLVWASCFLLPASGLIAQSPDLILHHGKIVTVDAKFSIAEAVAIRDGRIVKVGSNRDVLALKATATRVVDLGGKPVLPGLIDSHVHPSDASMIEFDHAIPEMETIQDVLDYIRGRAAVLKEGEWIQVRQVFITRLARATLPDARRTGPCGAEASGHVRDRSRCFSEFAGAEAQRHGQEFSGVTDGGPGHIEKDPSSGEPTGIIRSCTRLVKIQQNGRQPSEEDRKRKLLELFDDYLSVGLTSIGDRDASEEEIQRYRELHRDRKLKLRVSAVSTHRNNRGSGGCRKQHS